MLLAACLLLSATKLGNDIFLCFVAPGAPEHLERGAYLTNANCLLAAIVSGASFEVRSQVVVALLLPS